MSISSSLNSSVSGLSANANKLATISDNIANSSTFGYKRADVDFSSVVISQQNGSYSAGGVLVKSYREVDARAALVSTENPTDIAIGGRGMIPITPVEDLDAGTGNYPLMLTQTGSFRPNSDGFLVSESGFVLMGWPADANGEITQQPRDSATGLEPVQVNFNQYLAAPTTEVVLGANLPAEATQVGAAGTPLTVTTTYYDNVGAAQTLTFTFTPTIPAAGQSNEWQLVITDDAQGGATIGDYLIEFDDSAGNGGEVLSVTPATGSYDGTTGLAGVTTAAGPLDVELGALGSGNVLTQLSAEFAPAGVRVNGGAVGTPTNVSIDSEGLVIATYDSGFTRVLYQVPVANVPNYNGLRPEDGQAFTLTRDSGPLFFWDAGDGPTGEIIGFAREQSTADIAAELTQLIETQRAYSSNATVVRTVDEMLQETTNLKR